MRRFGRLLLVAILSTSLGVWSLSTVVHAANVVTSLADDGTSGTLRSVIAAASPGDTITFQSGLTGVIMLDAVNLGTLALAQNVTIQGPGAAVITVDGGCATCGAGGTPSGGVTVFTVNQFQTATISGLTIRHGNGGVGGGIYNLGTLTVMNSTISGNSSGGIASSGTLTVMNSTVNGNGSSNRGAGISSIGTLTVTNSTISGNAGTGTNQNGGGIASAGTLIMTNSTVSANTALGRGGGVYSTGPTTITGGTVGGPTAPDGNQAGGSGGGVYLDGNKFATDQFSLTGVTISHNTANDPATSGGGGGLYLALANVANTVTIANSTISNNTATDGPSGDGGDGGGINNGGTDDGTNTSTTTITNSTISGNTCFDSGPGSEGIGGGIANFNGTLNLVGSTVSGNTANGTVRSAGGGIVNKDFLNVTGSTISGNTAINGNGGGIAQGSTLNNFGSLVYSAKITNSTIVGNTVTGTGTGTFGIGGGLSNIDAVQLTYTTIARNTAPVGGGEQNRGIVQSLGTIIAANSGGDCANAPPSGGATFVLTSQGYNLDDDGSCTLTMPTDRSHDATPGLATTLAANGSTGPLTLALLPGSNAIDHGGTSANGCPATDERGTTRPSGAACDIGAFEFVSTPTQPPLPPAKPAGGTGGVVNPLPTPPRPTGSNAPGGPPAPLPLARK